MIYNDRLNEGSPVNPQVPGSSPRRGAKHSKHIGHPSGWPFSFSAGLRPRNASPSAMGPRGMKKSATVGGSVVVPSRATASCTCRRSPTHFLRRFLVARTTMNLRSHCLPLCPHEHQAWRTLRKREAEPSRFCNRIPTTNEMTALHRHPSDGSPGPMLSKYPSKQT